MTYSRIILEKSEGVARITLNRPDVMNSLDMDMLKEIDSALTDIEGDSSLRAVVITGKGKAFCAGADLKQIGSFATSPQGMLGFLRIIHGLYNRIEAFPKPVIAAINGMALAGGLELTLTCDIVYAAADAKIGDQHANFGLVAGAGGSQRLPRIIGMRRAKELLYTGDWISAQEAERIGLVNKVVPADKLDAEVMALAKKLVGHSPMATRTVKTLVNRGMQMELPDGLELEMNMGALLFTTEDLQEGLKAFQERRKPNFPGR
ncbi:MAG: enoyl-CoA hydratase [Chloroflexi bacterium]|nr:enoyl-CoA hydratase [Chloroflexota bacterium]